MPSTEPVFAEGMPAHSRRKYVRYRCRAIPRMLLEATDYDPFDLRVHIGHETGWKPGYGLFVKFSERRQLLGVEHSAASVDLVENQAERINVALDRWLASREQFRRHIGRCPAGTLLFGRVLLKFSQTKIQDFDPAFGVDHDVAWFQITMNYAGIVGCRQPTPNLVADCDGFLLAEVPQASQALGQILSINELHRQKDLAFRLAQVVNSAYVAVSDLPGGAYFLNQASTGERV